MNGVWVKEIEFHLTTGVSYFVFVVKTVQAGVKKQRLFLLDFLKSYICCQNKI